LPGSAAAVTQTRTYQGERSRFRRWVMLVAGTPVEAEALLQAAWEMDDRGEDATLLRRQASAVWGQPADAEQTLRLVDVLRRAGAFDEAAAQLPPLANASDDTTRRIAAYQQARIAARDTGRHLMSSALRPPATKPHVAHGRGDVGFWGRLFGGGAR
jgi:thioredoxin-like negative regulator of GroEL